MNTNTKLIAAAAIILLIGVCVGYFGGRKFNSSRDFEKTIDSIQTVNAVKDEMLQTLIEKSNEKLRLHNTNIKKNEKHYQNHIDQFFTDKQLDSIKRSGYNYLK